MKDYFFAGNQYIRVTRSDTGPGTIDPGYPKPISPNWGWGAFGANGIDAALYSGSKCYFFSGKNYIRVTRGVEGPGTIDPGYPRPIAPNWGWGAFGANGIDAALYSGSKCYFFSGKQYIRVTRGETGPGTVDAGYPRPISVWDWGAFGANGIDAALYSGLKCYFFAGNQYIRVSRSEVDAGLLDAGYPKPISSNWGWGGFGANGIDAALYSGGPLATVPGKGLGSNSNYFLYSPNGVGGCNHLIGLSVVIDVDEDIIGSDGFGFQLNAYSSQGSYDGAQQYVILRHPNASALVSVINNWQSKTTWLVNIQESFANVQQQALPAGYRLGISLLNDAQGRITGARYTASDNRGRSIGDHTISIANKPAQDLAPIVAFQLNFVDCINGGNTVLSSGSGTMTYTASNLMSVLNTEPGCVDWTYTTGETANSIYGKLPETPSQTFTQAFLRGSPAAMIRKTGPLMHNLSPHQRR